MFKKIFIHGLTAGVLAAVAGIIYNRIYFFATAVDYSKVLNTVSIIGLSVAACIAACFIFYALTSWLKTKGEVIFNFIFSMGSFACVAIPISISLPLDVQFPELFPGLAVPMIFFPVIAWMTIRPLFKYEFDYRPGQKPAGV
ncbi:hypothetical protein [Pollutibacter soli]|uniref:hypothetical protein n=1 Tax=Pollutibacter soli TaxID=3034157 RepID=UPI0030138593